MDSVLGSCQSDGGRLSSVVSIVSNCVQLSSIQFDSVRFSSIQFGSVRYRSTRFDSVLIELDSVRLTGSLRSSRSTSIQFD